MTGPDAQAPAQTPAAPEQTPAAHQQTPATPQQTPAAQQPTPAESEQRPGFAERGGMRRRARFLRKARELALRDLGGLVFDMHRFGQRTSDALLGKLATLGQIDAELRGLEKTLGENRGVTVLHEVGIAACPRCAAIHGRDDRFCPGCGLAFDSHAERPIATSPVSIPAPGTKPQSTAAAPPPAPPATPAPPIKPTAPPVSARPQLTPSPAGAQPVESSSRDKKEEDQPTEIMRPPVGGG